MKRKQLEELGLEKDAIDTIMDINGDDINIAKSEVETLRTANATLTTQNTALQTELNGIKEKAKGTEELTAEIEKLKVDNKNIRIANIVEKEISKANGKDVKLITTLLNLDEAEIGEDGTIEGLSEQIEAIKADRDYLFETKKTSVFSGLKPADGKDGTPIALTKEQFKKMSYKERAELYETDRETYDKITNTL